MIDENESIKTSRLISGGGFADPNHKQPDLPAKVNYYWNAYVASGNVDCLAKAIEHIHLNGSDAIMERLGRLWNAYLMSEDIECLARAIEITEIYGNQKITAEIAKILRDRPPTRKFRTAIKKSELDVLHKHLSRKGIRKEDIYRHLANFHEVEPESVKRELMRRRKKVTKK
jgi:hypothetical protein